MCLSGKCRRESPRPQVATWKAPASHAAADFQSTHGKLAGPVVVDGKNATVSPACATCHAREYCITCHVNAPEVAAIQALQPDPRSLAMATPELKAPASHAATAFMTTHGRKLSKQQAAQQCGILSHGDELRGLSHGAATAGAGSRRRGTWPGCRGQPLCAHDQPRMAAISRTDTRSWRAVHRRPAPAATSRNSASSAIVPTPAPREPITRRTSPPGIPSRPMAGRPRAPIATIPASSARPVTRRTASRPVAASSAARPYTMTGTRHSPPATAPRRARVSRAASVVTVRRTAWCAIRHPAGVASIRMDRTSRPKSFAGPIRRCAPRATPTEFPRASPRR